jgi:hypothetical protein
MEWGNGGEDMGGLNEWIGPVVSNICIGSEGKVCSYLEEEWCSSQFSRQFYGREILMGELVWVAAMFFLNICCILCTTIEYDLMNSSWDSSCVLTK